MAILVIENHNESAELIYEILMNEPNNIIFAEDGAQGLIAFRKYELSTIIIDLDISFIDSIELIKTVKKEKPNIRIITFARNYEDKVVDKLDFLQDKHFIKKEDLKNKLLRVYKIL